MKKVSNLNLMCSIMFGVQFIKKVSNLNLMCSMMFGVQFIKKVSNIYLLCSIMFRVQFIKEVSNLNLTCSIMFGVQFIKEVSNINLICSIMFGVQFILPPSETVSRDRVCGARSYRPEQCTISSQDPFHFDADPDPKTALKKIWIRIQAINTYYFNFYLTKEEFLNYFSSFFMNFYAKTR